MLVDPERIMMMVRKMDDECWIMNDVHADKNNAGLTAPNASDSDTHNDIMT